MFVPTNLPVCMIAGTRFTKCFRCWRTPTTKRQGAEITVLPPTNIADDTDGDSADEELLSSRDPNNLNRNLLLANTSVKVMKLSVDMRIGTEEDSSSSDESEDSPLAKIAGKMPAKKAAAYKPSWIKNDLKESDAKSKFPWNLSAPKSDEQKSPVSLFESFFTPQLMDHQQRN